MPIRQILLVLTSFPKSTGARSIENVVALAENFDAILSAIAFGIDTQSFIALYGDPFDVTGLVQADAKRGIADAHDLLEIFDAMATKRHIRHEGKFVRCGPREIAGCVVDEARFRDISIVPLKAGNETYRSVAEYLIFESGRPVLLLPDEPDRDLPQSLNNIAVAWDSSRSASRAVADALPFLVGGKHVRIFTVVDDKPLPEPNSGGKLSGYLANHGVEATLDEVRASGRFIGDVFKDYVDEHKIELLVMGGYGHSRVREFILGGATRSILAKPPTWSLLSH